MNEKVTAIIVGLGARGMDTYGEYILNNSDNIEVTGITDLIKGKLNKGQKAFNLKDEACFNSAKEILSQDKMADCALICTQDQDHVEHATMAIEKGYHILLEKPVSDDMEASYKLEKLAKKHGRHVIVCHVLRYTPFYNKIKDSIENGDVGEIVTVQAIENVGYWHQAHSFVRGNWRKASETSPMILAKSCHDLDILLWLVNKECQRVSSFGSNYLFKKEKAPKGSTMRCTDDCLVREDCPYDAVDFYVENPKTGVKAGNIGWPINTVTLDTTAAGVMEALKTGPYGKCVYQCDNDVVDHQIVNMLCEDDLTISFTMTAFTDKCYRHLKVMGTKGCIEANMDTNIVTICKFGEEPVDYDVSTEETIEGHGGGDPLMMKEFIKLIKDSTYKSNMQATLSSSLESHAVALKAEESRLKEGKSLEVK